MSSLLPRLFTFNAAVALLLTVVVGTVVLPGGRRGGVDLTKTRRL